MPTLKIDDITTTSFAARVVDLSTSWGQKYISWFLDGEPKGWDETISESDPDSSWITFDDLEPGTTYTVEVVISYDDAWDDRLDDEVTTEPEDYSEPDMTIRASSSEDGTSITAYARKLNSDYPRDDRYIVWSLDGEPLGEVMYVAAGDSTSDKVTWTGLTPGETYVIGATIWVVNNGEETWGGDAEEKITTENPESERPDEFQWTYAKVKGKPFKLTAQEWCDLLDNINAVLEYKGKSKATTGTGLAQFTYPSSTDTFTALMYNQCLYQFIQLGLITETEYGESYSVSPGDPVTADCLNLLVEMINSIE